MPANAFYLLGDPSTQLRQEPVPGRIRAPKQTDEADGRTALQKLSRQLECNAAAGAKANNDVRAVGPERADLACEVPGQILDPREQLALAIETRRLQPEERLIVAKVLHQRTVAEDVAVVSGHRKNGFARSTRLQRHDGALLFGERHARA